MPKFTCWDGELGPYTERELVADTPSAAAERFAAIRDRESVEYPPESVVMVRDAVDVVCCYRVALRSEPVYTAKLKHATYTRVFRG